MSPSGLIVIGDHTAEVKARVRAAGIKALQEAGDELGQVASQTAPKEEGVLESDWICEVDSGSDPLVGQVAWGIGESKAYAVRQHEETGWQHDAGRRAKWLEMAAKENARRLGVVIAMVIKGELQ